MPDPRQAAPDRLADHLNSLAESEWGSWLTIPEQAEGLCKRASLRLLADLEVSGIQAELWCLSGRGPDPEQGGFHYVLKVGDEAVDVSARQFDPDAPFPMRTTFASASVDYACHRPVDPDDRWNQKTDGISPNWRQLRDADPPGDLPGWPYPR